MSQRLHMLGQTPDFSKPSLCASCRNAHIMKGRGLGEEITMCNGSHMGEPFRILRPIMECTEYDDKSVASLYEMQKIAWKVSADHAQRAAGFLSPKKYKEKYGDDD